MTPNIHNCVNVLKEEKRIKVEGYQGYWSVIDDYEGYVLLEHNTYGDLTSYLVVKAKDFIWKEFTTKSGEKITFPYIEGVVYETFDDIITCLEDECTI